MLLTLEHIQKILKAQEPQERTESLCQMLDYPIGQRDSQGSRFWYLRAGNSLEEAKDTCPIAVGFYQELDKLSPDQASQWLVEQDSEIRGHYLNRVAEDKPVMYLLLPQAAEGTIAMILPTESKLRQRSIQTFSSTDGNIASQLARLHWSILADKVLDSIIGRIPQVDWIFYKSAQSAQELAQLLAKIALKIELAVSSMYHDEPQNGYLHKLLESFQKELLPNLKLTANNDKDYSFADIYAQTIAYGLFTARVFGYIKEPNQDFNRANAAEQLPETNPFLKQLFEDISKSSVEDLGDDLVDAIAEAMEILRAAKMDAILSDFRHKMNREDIVIRFYEDFLAAYKPKMRERRGVYYTPEPVVSYMVRSVDLLVQEKFNKPLGLADPEVMILDPACGTGTFLLWIFQLIYKRFLENPALFTEGLEDKSWSIYVKERLLPRVFGFELLMAPYAICHLKLGLFLEETGYKFDSGKRLGVYLTNTLEDVARKQEVLFKEFIAQESDAATEIKRDLPIMLVIGNPPYSGHSENNNKWIKSLVNCYYFVDGKPLGEKNPKWLQDDYVKFIRFAQWRIDQSSQGILAFISNHGFLDNPTFRGMRQSLINSFDGISVYDLHGNNKKKEKQSDGSADENVFDIQQGVAITLAVKGKDKYIKHSHLFGSRENKYQILTYNTIKSTDFTELTPQSEFYLLTPQDNDLFSEYGRYWKITDMMPINVLGFQTHRDDFAIDFERETLYKRINEMRDPNISDHQYSEKYNIKDNRDWNLKEARKVISFDPHWDEKIISCLYRPFDWRNAYYSSAIIDRPRRELINHVVGRENLCLLSSRQQSTLGYRHCWITRDPVNDCVISTTSREANQVFPLYLYPDPNKPQEIQQEKRSNFSPEFLREITEKLGYLPTPEEIFYYIYAVFHSPTYRSRYAEFLKIDFPRVPLTKDKNLFNTLSEYGEKLAELHLMTSPLLDNLPTNFVAQGDLVVAAGYPKYNEGTVEINKQGDAFTGVAQEVWNFYIGGYQVCQKWLKDRKGRVLSVEDIVHYQKIVVALGETIKLMQMIDEVIPGWPIE